MTSIIEDVVAAPAPVPVVVDLPDPELTPNDVLLLAADYLDEHGWTTRAFTDDCGHVCALGAIKAAIGMAPDQNHFSDEESILYTNAGRLLSKYLVVSDVAEWNDNEVPRHKFFVGRKTGGAYVADQMRKAAACG